MPGIANLKNICPVRLKGGKARYQIFFFFFAQSQVHFKNKENITIHSIQQAIALTAKTGHCVAVMRHGNFVFLHKMLVWHILVHVSAFMSCRNIPKYIHTRGGMNTCIYVGICRICRLL